MNRGDVVRNKTSEIAYVFKPHKKVFDVKDVTIRKGAMGVVVYVVEKKEELTQATKTSVGVRFGANAYTELPEENLEKVG